MSDFEEKLINEMLEPLRFLKEKRDSGKLKSFRPVDINTVLLEYERKKDEQ